MNGDRHEQVATRLRAAFQEAASLAMAQADSSVGLAEFHARLRRDRRHRVIRAISAACVALLAGLAAAIGISRAIDHPHPVRPPTIDPGGPRLNDPGAHPIRAYQDFTGVPGKRYYAVGFGPEFSFVDPPPPWGLPASETERGAATGLGRVERAALYLVRGDDLRSTQRLSFLIWRHVLDDDLRQAPVPDDIAAWLATNRHLANVRAQPATISGIAGVRVDAEVATVPAYDRQDVCGRPVTECLLLADNAEQPNTVVDGYYRGRLGPRAAFVGRDQLVRFWIVPLPNGEPLVIHASAPRAEFAALIADADQIVRSLVIAT